MPRMKKNHKVLNCQIDADLFDQLGKYCEDTGRYKTAVVEIAIKAYLDQHKKDNDVMNPLKGVGETVDWVG